MEKLRQIVAIILAKLTSQIIKLSKKGGGTALPGIISLTIDPKIIKSLTSQLPKGVVIISGTNGKTTTARILATILSNAHIKFIHNRAGSNLLRGIAATLVQKSTFNGKIDAQIALFETDEATLPLLIERTTPAVIIITNLFRDQLDRYGEIDTIYQKWQKAVSGLPKNSILLLNADDPAIAALVKSTNASVFYYGIDDKRVGDNKLSRFADSKYCSWCATPLDYELVYISHLGHYTCKNCGQKRPQVTFISDSINLMGLSGSQFNLHLKNQLLPINFGIPGLYNIYNALAAASAAYLLSIDHQTIKKSLESFKAAFGRVEELNIDHRKVIMFLVKNPTGFNEVIRTLFAEVNKKSLLIAVNDLLADGRDVSWLWDVDFEKMADKTDKVIAAGTRAYDLGLRLKYAGVSDVIIKQGLNEALTELFIAAGENQTVYILPTYTAMLEIRKKLAKVSKTGHFWED